MMIKGKKSGYTGCLIKTEFDNPKKFKVILQKFLYENNFIPWMNILNFIIWTDI